MPHSDSQTTKGDFEQIVKGFDELGYDLSFRGYTDTGGPAHTAIATSRTTKKQRTMTDRYEARNAHAIAEKLLTKLRSEAATGRLL